jgi:hypothetical protein
MYFKYVRIRKLIKHQTIEGLLEILNPGENLKDLVNSPVDYIANKKEQKKTHVCKSWHPDPMASVLRQIGLNWTYKPISPEGYQVVFSGAGWLGKWYLVAHNSDKNSWVEWRLYNLLSLHEVQSLDEVFGAPAFWKKLDEFENPELGYKEFETTKLINGISPE